MMTNYVKSAPPHIHGPNSVSRIYWTLSSALFVFALFGCFVHGLSGIKVVFACLVSSLAAEWGGAFLLKKKATLGSGHSVYLALLISLILPVHIPALVAILACLFAIFVGKEIPGGLGSGFLNPAALAVVFTFVFAPGVWAPVQTSADTTPFFLVSWLVEFLSQNFSASTVHFFVTKEVTLGGTSGVLVLLVASILLAGKTLRMLVPIIYLITSALLCFLFKWDLTTSTFSASSLLGAFILINASPTLPLVKEGRALVALLAGVISLVLWRKVEFFVALSISILVLNFLTPWLEAWFQPTPRKVKNS